MHKPPDNATHQQPTVRIVAKSIIFHCFHYQSALFYKFHSNIVNCNLPAAAVLGLLDGSRKAISNYWQSNVQSSLQCSRLISFAVGSLPRGTRGEGNKATALEAMFSQDFAYSFFLRTIRPWNSLSPDVVSSVSLNTFKQSAMPAITSAKVPSQLCRL